MTYQCTKCDHVFSEAAAYYEIDAEGFWILCPTCNRMVAEHRPPAASVDPYLPNEDQCRYLIHLCQKQIAKLDHAKKQLEDLMTKTDILLELAKERSCQKP